MQQNNPKDMKFDQYPFKSYEKLRYNDTDRQGHVNNAVFSTLVETGRIELLYIRNNTLLSNVNYVIAHLSLDYINEIKYPGTVEIGTAVTKIGNSSITLIQGIYQNGILMGTAESVIVQVDDITKKSKPLSEETKQFLRSFLLLSN